MKQKPVLFLTLILCFFKQVDAQIESNLPDERMFKWNTVGFQRNPANIFPEPQVILELQPPSLSPDKNFRNLLNVLNQIDTIDQIVEIRFKEGNYIFNRSIFINKNNLILRGEGENKTKLTFSPQTINSGVYGLRLEGKLLKSTKKNIVLDYCKKKRKIVFADEVVNYKDGCYLDIRVQNGSWYNSTNAKDGEPAFFLGQIVKVKRNLKKDTEFILDDDISLVWEMAVLENKEIIAEVFQPVKNVGIFSLIVESKKKGNGYGSNFLIRYAADCWIENIESVNPPQVHFDIDRSSTIVVKNNFIHHTQDYGKIPGAGYGVHIHSRSSNCLIENNIFYYLRHSMVVSRSANKNVFAYNFSTNQYSYPVSGLSDLNVHGFYPFGNLFEGNIVERIQADSYWGSNGPFNTFLRNYITDGYFKIEMADYSNSILNSSPPQINKSKFVVVQDSEKKKDISYYLKQKPGFLQNWNWPPIGNENSKKRKDLLELIPAQRKYKIIMK